MAVFLYGAAGNTEAQQLQAQSFLFAQDSAGKASTGVLTGLAVSQTTTASGSVLVGAGAAVAQASTLDGAGPLGDVSQTTLDVFTANPMGGVPRNDIVVIDRATKSIRVITGTPNAVPTDPSVPTSAVKLARLRHAASATTIPSSAIDDLRVFTRLFPNQGKRTHWANFTSADVNRSDATGIQTGIAHGAGFTPSVVTITPTSVALQFRVFNFTPTTFDLQVVNSDGSANGTTTFSFSAFFGE